MWRKASARWMGRGNRPSADRTPAKCWQPSRTALRASMTVACGSCAACYAKSLVQLRRIDVQTVANEKKRVIAREKVLEWFDPLPGGLDAVGGLANLKSWLMTRALAYSPAARAYGLQAPKGVLVVGI